jgi:hypothetical protein
MNRNMRHQAPARSPHGGAGLAVGDVVFDGVVEQHGVLQDDADAGAQGLLLHVADVLAVDPDVSAGHVVEAEQQARMVDLPAPDGPTMARSCRPARGS